MSIRNIVIGLVVLGVLGGLFWFSGGAANFVPKPTPTPLANETDFDNLITASGTLLPSKRANLSFKIGGQVVQVGIKPGDQVKKGDALARLDAAELEASVKIAEANFKQLQAGATKEEIAAAQAGVDAAQAQLAKARADATAEDIEIAKATLDRALAGLKDAQSAYDKIKDDPAAGMYPQSQAYEAASQQYRIAEASYIKVIKGASPEDIRIAETNVAAAQTALNRVQAGARPEEITAAQARVDLARIALASATLSAPFDGTIAAVGVRQGEIVSPGIPIVTLGDLSDMRLETDDLSETNILRVQIGQVVNVSFEAIPEIAFVGKVTEIAPISSQKQGGTNYAVTIVFNKLDAALRWGMTGHIEINTKQ